MKEGILILDFGSQYTHLIARALRELSVYCEIWPYTFSFTDKEKLSFDVKGVVLSGSPHSVAETLESRIYKTFDKTWLKANIPLLGICFGMQLIAKEEGAKVLPHKHREYGAAVLILTLSDSALFKGVPKESQVWMSHGDSVVSLPAGFLTAAKSNDLEIAAFENRERKIYGVQFHPEVSHTKYGKEILKNFSEICEIKSRWEAKNFIQEAILKIKEEIKEGQQAICGVSGGVDSTVAAVLVDKAIGNRLICLFINNGLLRKDEEKEVLKLFKSLGLRIVTVDASSEFIDKLKGVVDPEEKRKIIGHTFIEVFEREAKKFDSVQYLVQGTLYPDVIESVSVYGPSAVIKTHHNVGGLPEKMNLKVVEPLRELFKDEVRKAGKELGIPYEVLIRHPFPGPGLAVRILGEVTKERLSILKEADSIVTQEIKSAGIYDKLWQAFVVLLPVKSVGVMGDERTYQNVAALRAVVSRDAMTASWAELPYPLLRRISDRIIREVAGINRVVYDISSKPPATIEWE
ncbi:MAG: glutamine-hydrolyzing GMP synthase [Candidatus Dadabacteria bacterium]|nr:MAG: glutamine-hydrolyzing GMP synthase [Candidatus Dadabacteria bacterium]